MSTALICLDAEGQRVIGVWVPGADGKLDEAFRGSPLEYQRAKALAQSCPPALSWDDYTAQLADRTPISLWWESKEVPDGTTADQVLQTEVAKTFSAPASE